MKCSGFVVVFSFLSPGGKCFPVLVSVQGYFIPSEKLTYWLCNKANKMFFGTLRKLGLGCILIVVIWYIERKLRPVVVCILVVVNVY